MGTFTYDTAAKTWTWSDEMYEIHGFEPGDIVPTTGFLLAHKHPDDRSDVRRVFIQATSTGEAFSHYYRLLDSHNTVRHVVAVGHGIQDDDNKVTRVNGFLIDLTRSRKAEIHRETHEAVTRSAEHRASIEQAKGALMAFYGIDDAAAFSILSRHSQLANVKLWQLANDLVQRLDRPNIAKNFADSLFETIGESAAEEVATSDAQPSGRR
ncbi:PAS and ANTAR domain-containing protein [Saxibacter everestensis]|uniref:histidine kinase n=1 Tax=Saxibacter everestensis TaxID=2909229 RepID=A0ABY8QTC2_9MICO|nr:PAS and ANTAR domain-containing protein [Brevibacteriaceae bacterium ZFBP1038]